ncbi:MAG TPA: dihydrodipicolinate reductase C-terminal domain-containing protein, partial [Bryobacteraceae bacterium]|nr:dihydrodipicolinate reductase C-terminal domain-containing protein [Bryobacteraceae bacterium]
AEVTQTFDEHNNAGGAALTPATLAGVDVAIEFSTPEACIGNIERLAAAGTNTVVGTTGWTSELDRARTIVDSSDIGLVWSPNFSIGVNVFDRIVRETSALLERQTEYGAWAWEIHHDMKKDAPSGTLLKLVESMKAAGYSRNIDVSSSRAGRVPGTHEIGFDSEADTITLRHTARSREGFARGALMAAKWLYGRRGFYHFSEVLFGNNA